MKDSEEVTDKESPWRKQIGDRSGRPRGDLDCEKQLSALPWPFRGSDNRCTSGQCLGQGTKVLLHVVSTAWSIKRGCEPLRRGRNVAPRGMGSLQRNNYSGERGSHRGSCKESWVQMSSSSGWGLWLYRTPVCVVSECHQ